MVERRSPVPAPIIPPSMTRTDDHTGCALLEAADPATPPWRLAALADDPDPDVRMAVAAIPRRRRSPLCVSEVTSTPVSGWSSLLATGSVPGGAICVGTTGASPVGRSPVIPIAQKRPQSHHITEEVGCIVNGVKCHSVEIHDLVANHDGGPPQVGRRRRQGLAQPLGLGLKSG